MAFLDNGMQINTSTPGYVENHSLNLGPLSDLIGSQVTCIGLENAITWPIGYVIILIQVDGVQGYDEDQIALVVPDLSNFVAQVPMILGTPMIGHIMNVIKESEMDVLATPWVNAWVAYLLAVWRGTAAVEDDKAATKVLDPTEYDEVITTKVSKMIAAFLSKIIHVRTKTAFTGVRLNVMSQPCMLRKGHCPKVWWYRMPTRRCTIAAEVAIVVRNGMAYPQTQKKKIPVVRVVVAIQVPEAQMWPGTIDVLGEVQGIQTPRMTMEQRQEKLFEKLGLSSLGPWPPELADSAHSLLTEYHDIFSLESCKLSCTHLTEHVIKVTNDVPFREWFRQIPLPLVEEVHVHLWEMLD